MDWLDWHFLPAFVFFSVAPQNDNSTGLENFDYMKIGFKSVNSNVRLGLNDIYFFLLLVQLGVGRFELFKSRLMDNALYADWAMLVWHWFWMIKIMFQSDFEPDKKF